MKYCRGSSKQMKMQFVGSLIGFGIQSTFATCAACDLVYYGYEYTDRVSFPNSSMR